MRQRPKVGHRIFPDWAWRKRPHAYTCPFLLTLAMKWRRWRMGKEIHWTGYRKGRGEPIRICRVVRHADGCWHGVEMSPRLPLWMIFAEFCFWQAWQWVALAREGKIGVLSALRHAARSVSFQWSIRERVWVWGGRTWWSRS